MCELDFLSYLSLSLSNCWTFLFTVNRKGQKQPKAAEDGKSEENQPKAADADKSEEKQPEKSDEAAVVEEAPKSIEELVVRCLMSDGVSEEEAKLRARRFIEMCQQFLKGGIIFVAILVVVVLVLLILDIM